MEAGLSCLIEFSPTHTGTLVPEMLYKMEEDQESSNLCDDNTNSRDSDDYSSRDSSGYVEESFEVMFVPEEAKSSNK